MKSWELFDTFEFSLLPNFRISEFNNAAGTISYMEIHIVITIMHNNMLFM